MWGTGERHVIGENGRNPSGQKVLIFLVMEGFWPGDNCRVIADIWHPFKKDYPPLERARLTVTLEKWRGNLLPGPSLPPGEVLLFHNTARLKVVRCADGFQVQTHQVEVIKALGLSDPRRPGPPIR
jgi:hypothetical protein